MIAQTTCFQTTVVVAANPNENIAPELLNVTSQRGLDKISPRLLASLFACQRAKLSVVNARARAKIQRLLANRLYQLIMRKYSGWWIVAGQSHLDNYSAIVSILSKVEGCESGKTAHFNAVQCADYLQMRLPYG